MEIEREFLRMDSDVAVMIEKKKIEFSFHIKKEFTYFPEIE